MTKKYIQDFKSKLSNGGTLSPEELQDFFSRLEGDLKDKKYGLVWESQTEQVIEQLKTNKVYLHEDESLKITQDPDNPQSNILIEGDNYEALTYLVEIKQKVDVIYIDPPYNTGNKDFIYNDRFIDKEDGFRHSQWLSFMDARLRLARELLTDDGVIFISIDDNEQSQLKLLCDEVFGEQNFITLFTWVKKRKPSSLNHLIRNNTEYILCYAKNRKETKPFRSVATEDNKPYPFYNSGNKRSKLYFKKEGVFFSGIKNGEIQAGIYKDKRTQVELFQNITIKDGKADVDFELEGEWRYSQKSLDSMLDNNEVIEIKGQKLKPYYIRKRKGTLDEMKNAISLLGNLGFAKKMTGETPETYIGTNEDGNAELFDLDMKSRFDFPKPISLISFLTKIATVYNKDAVVLDFFAGSGTTGHAVLELNKEDGGNRQFILVTNNENNIARDVTYERNKRVIEGYTTPKGKDVPGIPSNLAYYKTKQVSKYDIDFDEVVLQHIIPTIQFTEGNYRRIRHSEHILQLGENIFIFNQYMVDDDEIDTLVDLVKDGDILYIQEGQVDYIKSKLPDGVVYKYLEGILPTNR